MDEEEGVQETLEPWEDLLVEGVEHMNIGTPTSHDFFSSSFKDIPIETFPKYVYFTFQLTILMIDCIRGNIFLHFTKFMKQTLFFVPSQIFIGVPQLTFIGVPQLTTWKPIQLKDGKKFKGN